jgi:hypothetical protein
MEMNNILFVATIERSTMTKFVCLLLSLILFTYACIHALVSVSPTSLDTTSYLFNSDQPKGYNVIRYLTS